MVGLGMQALFYKATLVTAFVALCFTATTMPAQTENERPNFPQRISLPWKAINYSHSFMVINKEALQAANEKWQESWFRDKMPLLSSTQASTNQQITINLKHRLQGVTVGGAAEQILGDTPIAAQPIICPMGDHSLIMISLLHSEKDYLLGSGHSLVPTKYLITAQENDLLRLQMEKEGKENQAQEEPLGPSVAEILSERIAEAGQRAVNNASSYRLQPDALQINFRNARKVTRQDYGSALCLNLLISEVLAKQGYQIVPSISLEALKSLKRVYPQKQAGTRATRSFKMEWSFALKPYPAQTSFPLRVLLRIGYAEAVFASGIGTIIPEASAVEFSLNPDRSLAYKVPEPLIKVLAQEKQALQLQDKPRISAIRRAWVYVDRGRAWGLRMRDRLVVGTEQRIKGHVVGFFGPELGLKSPRGHPIHEGAIIYIRKGQAEVRLGQEFDYDTQSYPTPWPPRDKG